MSTNDDTPEVGATQSYFIFVFAIFLVSASFICFCTFLFSFFQNVFSVSSFFHCAFHCSFATKMAGLSGIIPLKLGLLEGRD